MRVSSLSGNKKENNRTDYKIKGSICKNKSPISKSKKYLNPPPPLISFIKGRAPNSFPFRVKFSYKFPVLKFRI